MITPLEYIQVKRFLAPLLLFALCSSLLPCSWAGSWANTDFSQFFICFWAWPLPGAAAGWAPERWPCVAWRRAAPMERRVSAAEAPRGGGRVTSGWQLGMWVPTLGLALSVSWLGPRTWGELSTWSGGEMLRRWGGGLCLSGWKRVSCEPKGSSEPSIKGDFLQEGVAGL